MILSAGSLSTADIVAAQSQQWWFVFLLFPGGWYAPWPLTGGPLDSGWWGPLWFIGKTLTFLFIFVWLRGTLPRLRYDQFMALGWKVLIPASLSWIVVVSAARALRSATVTPSEILLIGGIVLIMLTVAFLLPQNTAAQRDSTEHTHEAPTTGSNYPVPPLDLVIPPPQRPAMTAAGSTTGGPPTSQEDGPETA